MELSYAVHADEVDALVSRMCLQRSRETLFMSVASTITPGLMQLALQVDGGRHHFAGEDEIG